MKYRLWDTDINRLFGTFDSEDDALALVRTLVSSYGNAYADDLALGCERSDGSFIQPLTGAELIVRAGHVASKPDAASRSLDPVADSEAEASNSETVARLPRAGAGRSAAHAAKSADSAQNGADRNSKMPRRRTG